MTEFRTQLSYNVPMRLDLSVSSLGKSDTAAALVSLTDVPLTLGEKLFSEALTSPSDGSVAIIFSEGRGGAMILAIRSPVLMCINKVR